MTLFADLALLAFLLVVAIAVARTRDLFAIAMLWGIYGLLSAAVFVTLDAPDVAMTEAAVGAGLSTVLMLATLHFVGRESMPARKRPLVALVVTLAVGGALVYGVSDLPLFGDPSGPAHGAVSHHYLDRTATEIGIPNVVTAVLASYRGYDTLGETAVILTAGIGVLALLGRLPRRSTRAGTPHAAAVPAAPHDHAILRVVAKILLPLILMFALYVQAHGEYSPGGGFQAGVVFATALVLHALVFGVRAARAVAPEPWLERGMAAGLLLYGGTGVVTMLLGGAFLDYDVLAGDAVTGQHLGIVVIEIGVGLTVATALTAVFFTFADVDRT